MPEFAPRRVIAGKDARTLAREILAMMQEEFSVTFRGSPMKRAKLRGLKRNSAVLLGNIGRADDVVVLVAVLEDSEPVVREYVAWVLARLGTPATGDTL